MRRHLSGANYAILIGAKTMPTIGLTNNTDVILTASSADDNATLNRYLKSLLTFKTPPSFDPISSLPVKNQRELDFPITLSATGEGKFAVEKTTLDVQLGASAALGLLQGDDASAFFDGLNLAADPSSSGLVSFAVTGTLTAEESAAVSDFAFGISKNATVTLTSYYAAAADDKLGDSVKNAIAALTIPHDIADLKSLPAGAICQVDAAGSLSFTASLTYSFLNDPLAAASISSLPSFAINATASATIEGSVTHTADHTITVARLPNGLIHLSVSLTKTDDFETSLTVSAGIAANIGSKDALSFLLDKINPNSADQADAIASQMKDAAGFKSDIKSAIDKALSTSLAASLSAALDKSVSRSRIFLYEINLDGLDGSGESALQSALRGDFTALTTAGGQFAGIKQLDSVLIDIASHTHTLTLHLLGIFNAASINQFVAKSVVDFTSDTHEIVLSDESLQVVDDNLNAEKLRKLVLKDITLTLPASANTKEAKTPINLVFIDREGSTSRSKLRQFVNVLVFLGAPAAGAAQALLNQNLARYGVCALSLGLGLDPAQCRQLFIGPSGANGWAFYAAKFAEAQKIILANDPDSAGRLMLFNADQETWAGLHEAGAASNMTPILRNLGMSDAQAQLAVADVITAIWWADAMADYATALAKGQSLESAGKKVVRSSNLGFNEPWMVLAAWQMAGKPPISPQFITSLPAPAAGAHTRL
jgi:hypothetical protein